MVYFTMPTNLPPEYFDAEKKFKQAATSQEKTAALEELIATVPKHKGTDKLRADLRKKLSKLREESLRKKKSGKKDIYFVEREGAAQTALAGLPNSGKSSLLKALTNARPVIAEYPVSTVLPLSGMMPYEDIQIQMVDLPPIGNESTDGWVSSILRATDIVIILLDLSGDPETEAEILLEQLRAWKIFSEKGDSPPGASNKKTLLAGNKSEAAGAKEKLEGIRERFGGLMPVAGISSKTGEGVEGLKSKIFEMSGIIRVYAKERGKEPDMKTPFTFPSGTTVLELAEAIHKDFIQRLKYACIWGSSKFPGQRVQKDYVLKDKDVVELHI